MQSCAITSSKCSRYRFFGAASSCLWWAHRWWYEPILPLELSFPAACRLALTRFILSLSSHLSRKRPADIYLEFLTNAASIVIVFLSELSGALMDPGSHTLTPVEAVELYLQEHAGSTLANMLSIDQQQKKLVTVANNILHDFLDAKSYDCEPARVFLREILAKVVLEMTVESCSKPDWINDSILYLLEGEEPELMNAIDAGVGGAAAQRNQKDTVEISLNEDFRDALKPSGYTKAGEQLETVESDRTPNLTERAMVGSMDLNSSMPVEVSERGRLQSPLDGPEPRADNHNLALPVPSQRYQSIHDGDTWTVPERAESLTSASSLSSGQSTSTFNTFDQIMPPVTPIVLTPIPATAPAHPNLQGARISILDDSGPGENILMRAKPTADFILQIEQASSQQPGWMITRKYADFENLHEVLRRISVISGLTHFTEHHSALPAWKGKTKVSLCEELERYLCDALKSNRLAESEGMKRFLSKDQGLGSAMSSTSGNLSFAFPSPAAIETMGRGVIDVLSSAPKGAAVGGKTLLGGVTGVLSGVGSKGQRKAPSSKKPSSHSPPRVCQADNTSSSEFHHNHSLDSTTTSVMDSRRSQESATSPRPSRLTDGDVSALQTNGAHSKSSLDSVRSLTGTKTIAVDHEALSASETAQSSLLDRYEEELRLPPPPSDIPDDYGSLTQPSRASLSSKYQSTLQSSINSLPTPSSSISHAATASPSLLPEPDPKASTEHLLFETDTTITENETQVTVDLVFAVINELYTLSSAWNIRRTFLNAARSYLLRPANPNLEAIRLSLQDSILHPYTSDSGLAALIEKMRENALPTDQERKAWPQPPSDDAKESRRKKARKVLVERGMPQALTAIMGAAASSEALGRVFDCLQSEEIARGLVFHLLLQAIKALTQ